MPIVLLLLQLDHAAVPLGSSQAAVRAGGGGHLETVAFPNGAHLSTFTRYRGSISVSHSRAFGNGGVSKSLEFTLQRAGCADCRLKPGLQRAENGCRTKAQIFAFQRTWTRRKAASWQWLRAGEFSPGTRQLCRVKNRSQSRSQPATDRKVDMRFQAPLYFESAKSGADAVRLHPTRLLSRPPMEPS